MSRFTTTTHTTSSQLLQPPHHQSTSVPPLSFRASGGIRSSLKKIPSNLFKDKTTRTKEKDKFAIFMDDNNATSTIRTTTKSHAIPSFLSGHASPPRSEKDKSKLTKKPKGRKGLADIFHWGNNANTNPPAQPVISPPSAPAPSPPRRQKEDIMPKPIRHVASKVSIPGLSGWTSLRPPAETPARARPSMGADPFGRKAEGAERVDQLNQCGELYERRGSVSSSKALSAKTLDSVEKDKRDSVGSSHACSTKTAETHDRKNSITSSKAISTKTVDSDYTIRYQGVAEIRRARHMSPVQTRATLVELPSRANSIARKPVNPPAAARPIPLPTPVAVQRKPSQPIEPVMRKEKTKSKVWGLLGIKPKKSKDLVSQPPSVSSDVSIMRPTQKADVLTLSKVPPRVSSLRALQPKPVVQQQPPVVANRPLPPTLHLTQPSVETVPEDALFAPIADTQGTSTAHASQGSLFRHSRTVPKRKSLNGLFGLSVKDRDHFEEKAKVKTASPLGTPDDKGALTVPEPSNNTLRRVASATDKLVDLVTHFNFSPLSHKSIQPMESLDSIASTIKEAHEGSPTPLRKSRSGVLSIRTSTSPLRSAVPNVSPLKLALHRKQIASPARKLVKQASHKNAPVTVSPKAKPNIFAMPKPTDVKPPSVSSVADSQATLVPPPQPIKKNIFAPPTPRITAAVLAKQPVVDETVGMRHVRPISAISSVTEQCESDVPQDLRDLFVDADDILSAAASPVAGLPQQPPVRPPSTARRRRNPPPAPLPVAPTPPSFNAAYLAITEEGMRDSVCSEFDFTSEFAMLNQGDQRASFVEALHRAQQTDHHGPVDLPPLPANMRSGREIDNEEMSGSDRESRSSTETVVVAARRSPFMGTFAFQQHASTIRASHSPKPVDFSVPAVEAPSPTEDVPMLFPREPEPTEDTTQLVPPRRSHRRDESGLSIATMSSIGAVIETGIAGEYTNYFEVEFARDNQRRAASTISADEVSQLLDGPPTTWTHSRTSSAASAVSRRGHSRRHSRNSSISSLASIDGVEQHFQSGPPISMHNRKRSSYISKHRKSGSFDAAFGRTDWAAHRRNVSTDSAVSIMSASRIARPGLGERMFQLDGGVQLTSITASPPEAHDDSDAEHGQDEGNAKEERAFGEDSLLGRVTALGKPSYDSLLDRSRATCDSLIDSPQRPSRDSLFDADVDIETSDRDREFKLRPVSVMSTASSSQDSIFGPSRMHDKRDFTLRPISTATTESSSSQDDTFVHTARYQAVVNKQPSCIEAQGEDTMTPVNIRRPVKPRSNRRRPAQLVFESDMDTPGLTSPSASETSSRMSLETRLSEGPYGRPFFAGHQRQRSSAAVQPQPTIKEEPSIANLRRGPADYEEVTTVRSYLDWEREADEECRRIRDVWEDSEESKQALSAFQQPKTQDEILRFLTQSAAMYKPLEQQLPKAHRRKSSLSDARVALSTYGMPLAKPLTHGGQPQKPRRSLITKFERTNSATSSHFSETDFSVCSAEDGRPQKPRRSLLTKFERTNSAASSHFSESDLSLPSAEDGRPQKPRRSLLTKFERTNSATSSHFSEDDVPPASTTSAIFAQFVREHPPTPPPSLHKLPEMSPFKFNLDSPASKKQAEQDKRARVTSSARRQALGWGKRRNSDGPAKVVEAAEPVPKIPHIFAQARAPLAKVDKENIISTSAVSPIKRKGSPVKRAAGGRRVTKLASVPKGLRA